jgi:hypothetical protein
MTQRVQRTTYKTSMLTWTLSAILPEAANNISDEMLVVWPNGRSTRIYTETQRKHHLRGCPPICTVLGWCNAYQRTKREGINSVLTTEMWVCIPQSTWKGTSRSVTIHTHTHTHTLSHAHTHTHTHTYTHAHTHTHTLSLTHTHAHTHTHSHAHTHTYTHAHTLTRTLTLSLSHTHTHTHTHTAHDASHLTL